MCYAVYGRSLSGKGLIMMLRASVLFRRLLPLMKFTGEAWELCYLNDVLACCPGLRFPYEFIMMYLQEVEMVILDLLKVRSKQNRSITSVPAMKTVN